MFGGADKNELLHFCVSLQEKNLTLPSSLMMIILFTSFLLNESCFFEIGDEKIDNATCGKRHFFLDNCRVDFEVMCLVL